MLLLPFLARVDTTSSSRHAAGIRGREAAMGADREEEWLRKGGVGWLGLEPRTDALKGRTL
jgi:hypothetical protein